MGGHPPDNFQCLHLLGVFKTSRISEKRAQLAHSPEAGPPPPPLRVPEECDLCLQVLKSVRGPES